jgi:integrase
MEPSGMIGQRAAERKYAKYGAPRTTQRNWVKSGEVLVAKPAAFLGDTVLLDEASLRRRIAQHSPHRDNQARRGRRRTIPEMQSERSTISGQQPAVSSNGHQQGMAAGHQPMAGSRQRAQQAAPLRSPASARPELVLLATKEWVARFIEDQRRHGVREITVSKYEIVFRRLEASFKHFPLERHPILEFVDKQRRIDGRGELGPTTKNSYTRTINTFLRWLRREYGYEVPDLTKAGYASDRPNAVPIWPDEIRTALAAARDHTEYTILLLLAQTGCRLGELCTIRPECLHEGWAEVWGKPTKTNLTGHRPLAIPSVTYGHLRREITLYGTLGIMTQTSGHRPLAGPPEPTDERRAIDWRDPRTYVVRALPFAQDAVKGQINRLLVRAQLYRPGLGAHSFRRAYESEFIEAGGDSLLCRRILGHFSKSDMDQLYLHFQIERMVAYAERYAPRSFLGEAGEQGKLSLAKEG